MILATARDARRGFSNVPMAHLSVCMDATGGREYPAEAKKSLSFVFLLIVSCIRFRVVPFDCRERPTEGEYSWQEAARSRSGLLASR